MMQTIARPTERIVTAPTLLTVKLAPKSPVCRQVVSLSGNGPVCVKLAA